MRFVRAWLARLGGVFTGHRTDGDLREELEAHLEMETAEWVRRGFPPEEARRRAMMASGGLTSAAEAVRAQRGLPWFESAVADLRYAVRSLRHAPSFTAVVVVTLALGIGANTAIFSVVRGVLLKPLPNRDGDRLLYLRQSVDGPGGHDISFSVPEVRDFRAGVPALGGVAEISPWALTLQGDQYAPSARIDVGLVTGNFFQVMGLSPILGRLTNAGDDGPGVPPVMVLTEEFWRQRFRGDPNIVGKQVRLETGTVTVIGVVQAAPFFPSRADAILNMVVSPHHLSATMVLGRTHRMTEIVGRLAPGATLDQARAQIGTTYARMQQANKDAYDPGSHYRVAAMPFKDAMGEDARLTLWLLMAAAAFVMIISTANVVNLTLMRGVRREQELVVRTALGAGSLRLRRLLLAENLVLAFLGAAAGVAIAVGGVRLLTSLASRVSPRASDIHLDTRGARVHARVDALGGAVAVARRRAPRRRDDCLVDLGGYASHRRPEQAAAAADPRRGPDRGVGRAARGRRTAHADLDSLVGCADGTQDRAGVVDARATTADREALERSGSERRQCGGQARLRAHEAGGVGDSGRGCRGRRLGDAARGQRKSSSTSKRKAKR